MLAGKSLSTLIALALTVVAIVLLVVTVVTASILNGLITLAVVGLAEAFLLLSLRERM